MTDEPQKPKIIVDGDWKSQVEQEKEMLRQKVQQQGTADRADTSSNEAGQLPPASFPVLVSMLATQALAALGQLPDSEDDKPVVQLNLAKHHIDTLAVLEEKTKGNLADDENQMLGDVLYQLRMLYVSAKSGSATAGT